MLRFLFWFFCSTLFVLNALGQVKNPSLEELVKKHINRDLTTSFVLSLSGDYYRGRNILDTHILESVLYIENVLRSQRIAPLDSSYRLLYNVYDTLNSYDIMSVYRGNKTTTEAVLLVANYDNLGVISTTDSGDNIYNGANDNISGVACLLQLAIFFSRVRPKQNIIFAFTSGKYHALRGACALATRLSTSRLKPKYCFNLEMLARPIQKSPPHLWVKGDSIGVMSLCLNKALGYPFFFSFIDSLDDYSETSEHIAVFNILKIPSYTITAFNPDMDELFMTPYDDINHIDLRFLHSSIERIAISFLRFITEPGLRGRFKE